MELSQSPRYGKCDGIDQNVGAVSASSHGEEGVGGYGEEGVSEEGDRGMDEGKDF